MTPRTTIAVELDAIATCLPPSKYKLGRGGSRVVWWSALGIMIALVIGLVVGPRRIHTCGHSKSDIASLTVHKYALEAYPEFRAANPERSCPTSLSELNAWMNSKDIRDPWGTNYWLTCSANGIIVGSAGEDGRFDTDDDVWSNE